MAQRRAVVRTVLAIAEGKAEFLVLNRIKALYVFRGGGLSVKVAGGYGGGGKSVLNHAIRSAGHADFDGCLALLDTDADWGENERELARRSRIDIIESDPCLEAWMLAIHGHGGERSSAGHKREFARRFGGPAHDSKIIEAHLTRDLLDARRAQVPALDKLLQLLGF